MENSKELYLTTVDNPYSYSKQYDEWLAYDESMGYFTNSLVARMADNYTISEHYNIDRINEYILKVYADIATMFPDLYTIKAS